MKVHQYLAVGFRLLSIIVFIYSLRQVATFLSVVFTDTYSGMPASATFFLIMAVIPLGVAITLWIFPTTIAKKVVPPESEGSVVPEKTFSIMVALVITVGLYAFFYAAIDAIYWLTYSYLLSSNPDAYDWTSTAMDSDKANMLATALEFAASLAIILRAKYIANFLYRVAR